MNRLILAVSTVLALAIADPVDLNGAAESLYLHDECATGSDCNQVSMIQSRKSRSKSPAKSMITPSKSMITPLSGTGPRQPLVIHFIRHGEVHNPNDILYGKLPGFHLTAKGFTEAEEGAAVLEEAIAAAATTTGISRVSSVLHSPMLRTRETAEVLTATSNLSAPLTEEPLIVEVHVPYNGGPKSVAVALNFDLYSHGQEDEGYENYQDVIHRTVEFVNTLRASPIHGNTQVVAVTHGDIALTARLWAVKGLAALMAGGPGKAAYDEKVIPYPDHVSFTTLVFNGDPVCEFPEWLNNITTA